MPYRGEACIGDVTETVGMGIDLMSSLFTRYFELWLLTDPICVCSITISMHLSSALVILSFLLFCTWKYTSVHFSMALNILDPYFQLLLYSFFLITWYTRSDKQSTWMMIWNIMDFFICSEEALLLKLILFQQFCLRWSGAYWYLRSSKIRSLE